jgi:hypothetical protein
MPKTPTPSAAIDALDSKLAELEARSAQLRTDQGEAKRRHEAARAHLVTLKSHQLAGENVTAELAAAEKAEAEARAEALAAAGRDWAAEAEAIDGAARQVTRQRAEAVTANAVPLIDELVPEADEAATRIIDAAAEMEAAILTHERIMRKAEVVLQHLQWYDRRRDIPARGDEFVDLRRVLDRLQRTGVPWPLPDLTKPPIKLLSLSEADRAAWVAPGKAA